MNLPSPTATSFTDTSDGTVRRTVDNPQNHDSGQYVISEDNSVYDPMNQRDGKAHLSIQDSQGDSQDDTKPVTVRATNFPGNDKGYDLIVMESTQMATLLVMRSPLCMLARDPFLRALSRL